MRFEYEIEQNVKIVSVVLYNLAAINEKFRTQVNELRLNRRKMRCFNRMRTLNLYCVEVIGRKAMTEIETQVFDKIDMRKAKIHWLWTEFKLTVNNINSWKIWWAVPNIVMSRAVITDEKYDYKIWWKHNYFLYSQITRESSELINSCIDLFRVS